MTANIPNAERKTELLKHALKLAEKVGYQNLTRKQVTDAAGLVEGTLSYHFGTMPDFRREVLKHAIHEGNAVVVMQGIAAQDRLCRDGKLDRALRSAALATLGG